MDNSNINPSIEVALEKGINNLFINMLEGRNFRKALWGYHPTFQNIDIITN
jgi:hypothetical protein